MRPPRMILLFAFVGGYADAAGYSLTKSFAGHITSNTVQTLLHLGQGAWHDAASNVSAIAGFLIGTACALRSGTEANAPVRLRQLKIPLAAEGALLLAAWWCLLRNDPVGRDAGVVLLCLGLGVQNGSLRSYGHLGFHTTYITGVSTSLLAAARASRDNASPGDQPPSRPILAGILSAFISGAFLGGILGHHFGAMGFAGIFVPWGAALLAALLD